MISYPNAKINLGLNVLSRREDGLHNLETVLYPIPWHDILEILPAGAFSFSSSGVPISGDEDQNLCVKAYKLLKAHFAVPPVKIHLHKIIPMGAGLGGGSSDATSTIKMLNQLFELDLSVRKMVELSATLGSDCPFFVDNIACLATGTGTRLAPLELDLSDHHIAIVYPEVHISTKEAYGGIQPDAPVVTLQAALGRPRANWQSEIRNDFEQSIFQKHPELKKIKSD